MTIYLASMKWCGRNEPIVAGLNKARGKAEALQILRAEHGKGPVDRGAAMCSLPIKKDDIVVEEIPLVGETHCGTCFRTHLCLSTLQK